jgi:DNA-binding cell septation regulator SpoVG
MHITIEHIHGKYPSFNVNLHSKEGSQPFLTVKSCRLVEGTKGPFVSWPSRKMDNEKYFNFCYASDGFQAEVIKAMNAATVRPTDTRTLSERRPKPPVADDFDVPF